MDSITAAKFAAGFVILIVGADVLVRGASRLAISAGISSLVVGLTVVAYGTSAPELAVTLKAMFADPPQPGIAVGNVVGSNISNVLLVLGIAASIAPLIVSRHILRFGLPLMIAVSGLMLLMGRDGIIDRLDGSLLFAGAMTYTIVTIVASRRKTAALKKALKEQGRHEPTSHVSGWRRVLDIVFQLVLIAIGLAMLVYGADWLVQGAVQVARTLGVSELIVGLTIVAVGTSLPEIATSAVAVIRGERDIAVGNVVGSNLFNILLVLGACGIFAPNGVPVDPSAIAFDIPVMIAVSAACLPVFFSGRVIDRVEGGFFLASYAGYVAYLCLYAMKHDGLALFRSGVLYVALPLAGLFLIIYWLRQAQQAEPQPKA